MFIRSCSNQVTFVYSLKLQTTKPQVKELERRFKMVNDIYYTTLREILKRDTKRKKDPRYKRAYQFPKGKERNAILNELRKEYDVYGKYSFGKFANNYRNARNYSTFIPSDCASNLGQRAWLAYTNATFADTKSSIKFDKQIQSFEGAKNSGLAFRRNVVTIGTQQNQLVLKPKFRNTQYEKEVFENRLKFCRLYRKIENKKPSFYVHFVFNGQPPQRFNHQVKGKVGIDIGVSTVAIASESLVLIRDLHKPTKEELDQVKDYDRQLFRLRKLSNPDNFEENGRYKTGRFEWVKSNKYLKIKNEAFEFSRKLAARRKLAHRTLANQILQLGDKFVVEDMDFSRLSRKCSSENKISFSKSISRAAPGELIRCIQYKANYIGKQFIVANTFQIKASQLDHSTGQYKRSALSERSKMIDGNHVQRDLYSAFLLSHVNDVGNKVDLDMCNEHFEAFMKLHNQEMKTVTSTNLAIASHLWA